MLEWPHSITLSLPQGPALLGRRACPVVFEPRLVVLFPRHREAAGRAWAIRAASGARGRTGPGPATWALARPRFRTAIRQPFCRPPDQPATAGPEHRPAEEVADSTGQPRLRGVWAGCHGSGWSGPPTAGCASHRQSAPQVLRGDSIPASRCPERQPSYAVFHEQTAHHQFPPGWTPRFDHGRRLPPGSWLIPRQWALRGGPPVQFALRPQLYF